MIGCSFGDSELAVATAATGRCEGGYRSLELATLFLKRHKIRIKAIVTLFSNMTCDATDLTSRSIVAIVPKTSAHTIEPAMATALVRWGLELKNSIWISLLRKSDIISNRLG